MNLWILVCSLGGSIYGVYRFYRPKKALFLKMISGGVSCLMFTELFMVIYMVTQGDLEPGFHVGMLGIIGSFMYLFSANYGQMDGLVDNRKREMLPTRLKAFAAPAVILLLYVVFCVLVDDVAVRIPVGIVAAFIIPCAYYNFKHIIIYDVKLGIIRQLRMYNRSRSSIKTAAFSTTASSPRITSVSKAEPPTARRRPSRSRRTAQR